jgi:molybdopterin-guanine dinucleotide biosynthesis protein A
MTVTLALLIGGRGTRMGGVDKSKLVAGSSTLADNIVATFCTYVADVITVGRAEQNPTVVDSAADEGPLRGIATALAYARTPWVFVVATDTVGLATRDLTALLAARTRGRCAIGWRAPHGPEPLCALYSRVLARKAERLLAGGERRAKALLDGEYLVVRATAIANVNTLEDLAGTR